MDAMSWGKKVPHSFLRSIICTSRALQSTAVVFELDPKSPDYASNTYIYRFVSNHMCRWPPRVHPSFLVQQSLIGTWHATTDYISQDPLRLGEVI